MIIFRATSFSVIQKVTKIEDNITIEDYNGRTYDLDDVTDSGEVFDPVRGWIKHFFLEEDLAIITFIAEKYRGLQTN
jgi:hypothetical protein